MPGHQSGTCNLTAAPLDWPQNVESFDYKSGKCERERLERGRQEVIAEARVLNQSGNGGESKKRR